jgi:hypothetical protein
VTLTGQGGDVVLRGSFSYLINLFKSLQFGRAVLEIQQARSDAPRSSTDRVPHEDKTLAEETLVETFLPGLAQP